MAGKIISLLEKPSPQHAIVSSIKYKRLLLWLAQKANESDFLADRASCSHSDGENSLEPREGLSTVYFPHVDIQEEQLHRI